MCRVQTVRTNGACLEPRVIAKAPPGEGCPRCGGYVYAAEQMLARGKVSCTGFFIPLQTTTSLALPTLDKYLILCT